MALHIQVEHGSFSHRKRIDILDKILEQRGLLLLGQYRLGVLPVGPLILSSQKINKIVYLRDFGLCC